jgi:hypothetical protein
VCVYGAHMNTAGLRILMQKCKYFRNVNINAEM